MNRRMRLSSGVRRLGSGVLKSWPGIRAESIQDQKSGIPTPRAPHHVRGGFGPAKVFLAFLSTGVLIMAAAILLDGDVFATRMV